MRHWSKTNAGKVEIKLPPFRIAMSPEDLAKSGLDELGKKWGYIRDSQLEKTM
jgi:hypothetical protein